jgi:cytochrome c-type biogenesis protein CcmH/NrfF
MRRTADRPATLLLAAALCAGAVSAAPAAAQSTGPSHAGFDPKASMEGHFHDGDLGEKALVLERNLKCSCGCRLDLHSCQFQMQCGVSPGWSQRIRDALAQGQSVETVQAGFVSEFGLTVLMAPPAEGFNLVGYLLPAFAILTAGVLVGLSARAGPRTATPAPVTQVTDADAERLRAAMRTLDEAESPDW